ADVRTDPGRRGRGHVVVQLLQVGHELGLLQRRQGRGDAVEVTDVLRGDHVHQRGGRAVVQVRRRVPHAEQRGGVEAGQRLPPAQARGRGDGADVVEDVEGAVSLLAAAVAGGAARGGEDGLAG